MLPGRIDDALLDVLVTPADAREIRARLKTRRSRVTEDELSVALRRLRDQGLVQRWITSGPPRRRTRRYELTWQGVRRVMAQPPRHEAAKSTAPPPAERRLMAERIRQCARLSQAAARLRAAGEAARSR